jgi:hypothetical protein
MPTTVFSVQFSVSTTGVYARRTISAVIRPRECPSQNPVAKKTVNPVGRWAAGVCEDGILGPDARPGLEPIKPDVREPTLPPVVLDLEGKRNSLPNLPNRCEHVKRMGRKSAGGGITKTREHERKEGGTADTRRRRGRGQKYLGQKDERRKREGREKEERRKREGREMRRKDRASCLCDFVVNDVRPCQFGSSDSISCLGD